MKPEIPSAPQCKCGSTTFWLLRNINCLKENDIVTCIQCCTQYAYQTDHSMKAVSTINTFDIVDYRMVALPGNVTMHYKTSILDTFVA